ncbi:MlaD family protein [Nocardia sp. NPDC006044]|uniref:MlaD family protein n=1 Tax=Nocardia sp. NPDC006044 TaxID=3364306 RepID=UPI003676FB49
MLRRLFASRGFVSALGALLAGVIAIAAGIVLLQPAKGRIGYCAILPDTIGLYVGNDVTLRGIKVGTVTAITNENAAVRVDFRIDAEYPLRGDPTATTVSDTVVADRRLAVNSSSGPDWKPQTCLTRTATPKSITQTLDALSTLADQLDGGGDPARRDSISNAVAEFDRATAGTGPRLNTVITQLASVLRSPDASIAHIGSLLDALTSLSKSVANGWGDLRQMLTGLSPILQLVNNVWDQVVQIVNSIVVLLPWINDITSKYGGRILGLLDNTVPFLDLAAAHAGSLQQLLDLIPVVDKGFRTVTDPGTGRFMVSYRGPTVTLDQPGADQICAALDALLPGRCTKSSEGLATTDLTTLILGMVGRA